MMARIAARVALVMVVVVATFTGSHGWQAEALPQGCPPQSSVCNPVGLALMAGDIYAGYETASGSAPPVVVPPGAVVSSTATTTTGTRARVPLTRGGALVNFFAVVVTFGAMLPGLFQWGEEPPGELAMEPDIEPGWLDGDNTTRQTNSGQYADYAVTVNYSPLYNMTGAVSITYDILGCSGSTASLGFIRTFSSPSGLTLSSTQVSGGLTTWAAACSAGGFTEVRTVSAGTGGVGLGYITFGNSGSIRWYPEGAPDRHAGIPGMSGAVTSTIQCGTGPGDLHYVFDTVLVTYQPGVEFEYPSPSCPEGEVVFGYGVTWTTTEGVQDIVPWTSTPEWVHSVPSEFPGCLAGGSQCELSLWRISSGAPEYCGVAGIGCQNWWQDANKVDNYECKYGPYVVDLGFCNVFRNPGRLTPNTPTEVDPKNGERASNGAAPDTSLDVGLTEYVHDPQPDPTPFPYESEDSPSGECFPSGWGIFNPVEWVLKPVKCALVWAFVPSATGPVLQPVMDAVDGSSVAPVVGFLGDASAIFGDYADISGGASCGEIANVQVDVLLNEPLVVTTCQPLIASVAPFLRGALIGLVWIGTGMLAIDLIARAFDISIGVQRIENVQASIAEKLNRGGGR